MLSLMCLSVSLCINFHCNSSAEHDSILHYGAIVKFLADRTNGRAIVTLCRQSVCRL